MANILRVRARCLSSISNLARTFHFDFITALLYRRSAFELRLFVRLLQHYLWWFALEGRARDERNHATLDSMVALAMARYYGRRARALAKNS